MSEKIIFFRAVMHLFEVYELNGAEQSDKYKCFKNLDMSHENKNQMNTQERRFCLVGAMYFWISPNIT